MDTKSEGFRVDNVGHMTSGCMTSLNYSVPLYEKR